MQREYDHATTIDFTGSAPPGCTTYAVFDAARQPDAIDRARECGLAPESLLDGKAGALLGEAAPYVVQFPMESAFAAWWFAQRGRSIGILLETPVDRPELRRHMRTMLIVRGEGRERYFFRFYDPRVAAVFLPACTGEEARRFFGPIATMYGETRGGEAVIAYSPSAEGVTQRPVQRIGRAAVPRA